MSWQHVYEHFGGNKKRHDDVFDNNAFSLNNVHFKGDKMPFWKVIW